MQGSKCNTFIDTGATKSHISEVYYKTLPQQNFKRLHIVAVKSVLGSSLALVGFMTCAITSGIKLLSFCFL